MKMLAKINNILYNIYDAYVFVSKRTKKGDFDMDAIAYIEFFYDRYEGLCNAVILLLVFGGMARVAFWREHDGLHVGGPLALGLAGLLTVALIKWANMEGRTITEFGPLAAFIMVEAVLIMGWAAFRKSPRN